MSESKRKWFEQALAAGVFVHLDPRCAGVVVPPRFVDRTTKTLVLQFALDCPIPIRDLEVDDEGVRATLSFDRKPFHCAIPWASVYGMVSGSRSRQWEESFPPELSQCASAPTADVRPISRQPKRTEKQAKRPKLTLIRGGLS